MKKLALLALLAFVPVTVMAQPASTEKPAAPAPGDVSEKSAAKPEATENAIKGPAAPILEKIKEQVKNVSFDYVGQKDGFDTWIVHGKGVMQMIYVPVGGSSAVVGGMLVDVGGKNVSAALQQEFAAKYPERAKKILDEVRVDAQPAAVAEQPKAPSSSEELWNGMDKLGLASFGTNKDAPVIYAVLDPAQKETKIVWEKLEPLANANKITFHIVPIALTTADNIMTIAQVLGSPDPAQGWRDVMNGTLDKLPQTPEPAGAMGMKANVEFAQSINLRNLPFLVYKNKDDKVRAVRGLPKNWDALTEEMGISAEKAAK